MRRPTSLLRDARREDTVLCLSHRSPLRRTARCLHIFAFSTGQPETLRRRGQPVLYGEGWYEFVSVRLISGDSPVGLENSETRVGLRVRSTRELSRSPVVRVPGRTDHLCRSAADGAAKALLASPSCYLCTAAQAHASVASSSANHRCNDIVALCCRCSTLRRDSCHPVNTRHHGTR
jgi:hypothetical protein